MPESDARLGYLSDAELAALEPSNTHTLTWRLVVEVRDWRKAHGDCVSKLLGALKAFAPFAERRGACTTPQCLGSYLALAEAYRAAQAAIAKAESP